MVVIWNDQEFDSFTTIQHMHCMFKFNCTEKIISGLNRHLYKCQ